MSGEVIDLHRFAQAPKDADPDLARRQAQQKWDRESLRLRQIEEGSDLGENRNKRLFMAVLGLSKLIAWGFWTAGEVADHVSEIVGGKGIDGWEATIESAIDTGLDDPIPWPSKQNVLRNYEHDMIGDPIFKPPTSIAHEIIVSNGGWPKSYRRERLFALREDGTTQWIESSTDLGGWLTGPRDWRRSASGSSLASMGEVYSACLQVADRVDVISQWPTEPPTPHSICIREPAKSTGDALRAFVGAFNPATELDRTLLTAALVSPAWGMGDGKRPIFLLTSDYGRGSGKSSTAEAIGLVYGPSVTIQGEGSTKVWDELATRLLSPLASDARTVLIDNVKGRMSISSLESMITSPVISGRQLYQGEGQRPNNLAWFLTLNTPDLSTDLAQRSIPIKLGEPDHGFDFRGWVESFLAERHAELMGDILAVLREDGCMIAYPDRWQAWQRAVLSKLEHANDAARLVKSRREEYDGEAAEISAIAGALQAAALRHGSDVLPTSKMIVALSEIWPDVKSARQVWARLRPLLGNGALRGFERSTGGRSGRGIKVPE